MRRAFTVLSLTALLFSSVVAPAAADLVDEPAEQLESWIVTLKPGAAAADIATALLAGKDAELRHVYSHALNGFAFRGSESHAAALRNSPNVARVERDRGMRATVE